MAKYGRRVSIAFINPINRASDNEKIIPSGRLFTMEDFLQTPSIVLEKRKTAKSDSDSYTTTDESSEEQSEENSTEHDKLGVGEVSKQTRFNRKESVIPVPDGDTESAIIRSYQQVRKRSKRQRNLVNFGFPNWHPAKKFTPKQYQHYIQVRYNSRYLFATPPKPKKPVTMTDRSLAASLSVPPPYLTAGGGLIGGPRYTTGTQGTQLTFLMSAEELDKQSKYDASAMMVEIGPGGVPPTNLKTVRRRAVVQLQVCESQITTYRNIWLKNGMHEDRIPVELDNFFGELDHVVIEALSLKAINDKMKKLSGQPSVAAHGAHGRYHNTHESLASQASSKPSKPSGQPMQISSNKKLTNEISEIRRLTSRHQLRLQLRNLLESKTLPIKSCDAKEIFEKSLKCLERLEEYLQLYDAMKTNLEATAAAVARYCVSFIHEVENVQVDCVWYFNNKTNELQRLIDTSLTKLEEARKTVERKERTCAAFLVCENNTEMTKLIVEDGVEQMVAILQNLRDWLVEDERYEVKLKEALKMLVGEQKRLLNSFKVDQRKKDELSRMALRREFKASLITEDGESRAAEGRRLQGLLENLEGFQAKLDRRVELKSRNMKPIETDLLLVQEVDILKRQLSACRKRVRAVKLRLQLIESDMVNISQAKQANLSIGRKESYDAQKYNRLASEAEFDLRMLEAKIRAVVRILDLKKNPDILKRIFYQQQEAVKRGEKVNTSLLAGTGTASLVFEPADTDQLMTSAISLVANEIGHNLPDLYRRLPFTPDRSPDRRKKDLIQLGCREITEPPFPNYPASNIWSTSKNGSPPTYVVTGSGAFASSETAMAEMRKLAFQILRKWRRLNKTVTVMQLAETLRSINQTKLADAIEAARVRNLGLPAIHNRARALVSTSI